MLSNFEYCCGCEACVQACPSHCIDLEEDEEGFLFPRIDMGRCVKCNKCEKVCPITSQVRRAMPIAGYAYRSRSNELLRRTSSGGFFTFAAEKVLSQGGVVFGAMFNAKNEVVHTYVETISGLDGLRRSKYVQSRIGRSFLDCQYILNAGRKVLFCGTPCQVKALKLFLGRTYDNLVTVDFVCHGVPSPGVFRRYLKELCEKYSEKIEDIKEINFREKMIGAAYAFSFTTKQMKYIESPKDNLFLKGFLSDIFLRKSCYYCSAKGFSSGADYTMCDFWSIEEMLPEFPMDNLQGVTQIFVSDDKLNAFETVANTAIIAPFDYRNLHCWQKWLRHSVPMTIRRRKFFTALSEGKLVCESISQFCKQTLPERIYGKVLSILRRRFWI